ncbi:MAG: TIR domain-containing protein [Pseudomonadota bacterium]
MADVFISYARADRARAEQLARALAERGLTVWWDRGLTPGADFSAQIERELAQAGAVLVCWSENSLQSRWVKDEADEAARTDKLVAVTLDGSLPPLGYRQYHALDLQGWDGDESDSLLDELAGALTAGETRKSGPNAGMADGSQTASAAPKRRMLPVFAVLLVALGALGVYFGQQQPKADLEPASTSPQSLASPEGSSRTPSTRSAPQPASIAVLAFADLSADGDQGYFADGLAEEILNVLARVDGLKVASRTSAFALRDRREMGIKAMAEVLGVRHVLEGSVRKAGDTVRITVQLIDALEDNHLYSEAFDRALSAEKLFQLQEDIARETVAALAKRGLLPDVDRESIQVATETNSLSAYEAYLEAHEIFLTRNATLFEDMLALFEQSVNDDPTFARAHAALSNAYTIMPGWGFDGRPYYELAKASAERALELDPTLGSPYAVLAGHACEPAGIYCVAREEMLSKAIANDPENPALYNFRGQYLLDAGYNGEANEDFRQCLEIDPTRILCRSFLMITEARAGRLNESFQMGLELAASRVTSLHVFTVAAMLFTEGRGEDARQLVALMPADDFDMDQFSNLMFGDPPAIQSDYDLAYQLMLETAMREQPKDRRSPPPAMLYFLRQFDQLKEFGQFVVWQTLHQDFLQSPVRYAMFEDLALPQYWRERSFPDRCQPLENVAAGERDYRCD